MKCFNYEINIDKAKKVFFSSKRDETDILKELNIESFDQITKEEIPSLTSLLPTIPDEEVKKILQQLPDFIPMVKDIGIQYQILLGKLAENCNKDDEAFYKNCDLLCQQLLQLLKSDNCSENQKDRILEAVLEINARMRDYARENKKNYILIAVCGAVGLLAVAALLYFVSKKGGGDIAEEEPTDATMPENADYDGYNTANSFYEDDELNF